MTRLLAVSFALSMIAAVPAVAATRTADAARAAGARLSPVTQPIRATLRTTAPRKTRYDLSRMMARNFGAAGQRQLDLLVASVQ